MAIVYENLDSLKEILDSEKPSSILLMHGNKSYEKCGARKVIEKKLKNYNVACMTCFEYYPEIEEIKKIAEVINKKKADFIIAIGGGTVLDSAKAASVLYNEKSPFENYVNGKKELKGNSIEKLLIPTTAGTGAEITPFSVIYINKTKCSLEHPDMLPKYIVLEPKLTYSLDKRITAQTGCDALAQAIEGFWATKATKESKKYSRKAIPMILDNIDKAVNNPSPENRKAMLLGAHLSGKSIAIAKTTAAHSFSYPLTSCYNVPHGHAVMLTLPYLFPINEKANAENIRQGLNLKYVRETFGELLKLLKVKDGGEAKEKLTSLMDKMNLERKLSRLGIAKKDLKGIVDNGFNPQRITNNPVKITKDAVREIFKEIY